VLNLAKKHLGKKVDVAAKLAQFENPVDIIENAVMKLQSMPKADGKTFSKRKIKN
jgi:hypothetical protein